jgi:hypothetical protein
MNKIIDLSANIPEKLKPVLKKNATNDILTTEIQTNIRNNDNNEIIRDKLKSYRLIRAHKVVVYFSEYFRQVVNVVKPFNENLLCVVIYHANLYVLYELIDRKAVTKDIKAIGNITDIPVQHRVMTLIRDEKELKQLYTNTPNS